MSASGPNRNLMTVVRHGDIGDSCRSGNFEGHEQRISAHTRRVELGLVEQERLAG